MNKMTDGRRLKPAVLRTVVNAIIERKQTLSAISAACNVSLPTLYRLANLMPLDLSVRSVLALSDSDLAAIFYPMPIDRTGGILLGKNVLLPDFEQCARDVVEGEKKALDLYRAYTKEAAAQHKGVMSKSYFYKQLQPLIDAMRGSEPDYYIAQDYPWGVFLQADFSGMKVPLLTPGGTVECWILAAVWPKSYYVGAGFVRQQSTAEACRVFDELFKTWQAVPMRLVVDNAKCFVTKHSESEALINPSFNSFMLGYGIYVEPAPYYRPQRKSSAEFSVRLLQDLVKRHWREFTQEARSIAAHSAHLMQLIAEEINNGSFRGSLSSTRTQLFKTYEKPNAHPLPEKTPQFGEVIECRRVPRSCLIKVKEHEYSVPYLYAQRFVDIKITPDAVEFWYAGECIAQHVRSDGFGRTVLEEHKSPVQQEIEARSRRYATNEDILAEAQSLSSSLHRFCKARLDLGKGPNDRSSCIAVINYFKRAQRKDLFAEACESVLRQSSSNWNVYCVKSTYNSILNEELSSGRVAHQAELEVFSDNQHVWLHSAE